MKNSKKIAQELFKEIVKEYENEKMLRNRGFVEKTTTTKFLSCRGL